MAIQKQNINVNFVQGVDTKTDPFQVEVGKFLSLKNSVFQKAGLLKKRNGFGQLPNLPDDSNFYSTTFKGNLTAIGTQFNAFADGPETWVNKGSYTSLRLDTLPLIRSNTNQSYSDTAYSDTNLVCVVFTDNVPNGMMTVPVYKYAVLDSMTGQTIINSTEIPMGLGVIDGSPKVFSVGRYFIIVFTNIIGATPHLQYFAINQNDPSQFTGIFDITALYTPATTVAWDGTVVNDNLYLAWNGADMGGAIRTTYISSNLTQFGTVTYPGFVATNVSVTADLMASTPTIYVSFYDTASQDGYTLAYNQQQDPLLAPTQIINGLDVANITSSVSESGWVKVFYELNNAYSYDPLIATNYVESVDVTISGMVSTPFIVKRSLGLASEAFVVGMTSYFMGVYDSENQSTYFVIDEIGNIVSKLAYANAGPLFVTGLPSVSVINNVARTSYLFQASVQAVNKNTGIMSSNGVFAQLGINHVDFDFNQQVISSSEIGLNLNLSGGFIHAYDGVAPVEQGFFLYPDSVDVQTATTGGLLTDQQYFYQVTYEWSDNQGNLFRSAPSIPVSITTTGGGTSANTISVPTLRLTQKIDSPVKIVIYRYSVGQPIYYQVTSIQDPILNDTTVDSISFVDTLADSAIIGNNILYTTGGVVENIGPPASDLLTIYKSRLFLVDSENRNTLWFSKTIIQNTPVEMSDLFTIFVSPTIGAQGSTGEITAIAALDDKLIIFKQNAIYYITGDGPDNTGQNSDFSEPVFVTSTIGCTNQNSIVFMPNGLMFQSDKGIWLLGRDLSTDYIGAPVEDFNQFTVLSALNIPGTNEVRFTLNNGQTLMFDYFFGQWGVHEGAPSISSTLYQNLHTFINRFGEAFQETVGSYLDGSKPVLMSFTTSWLNFAGLQGFQRAYFFYLMGVYKSPHKLSMSIAYDYNSSASQVSNILPINYNAPWGSEALWGSGNFWGGTVNLEQWRIFLERQKCQSFQITMQEIFDPTFGQIAGEGLTLSGLNIVVGLKSGYPRLTTATTVG